MRCSRSVVQGSVTGHCRSCPKPICSPSTESQNADFFNAFFQNDYQNYADIVAGTLSTVKTDYGYEITATVNIAKDNLRKAMEQAGIVRKLGF